jgi:hypothetical protein
MRIAIAEMTRKARHVHTTKNARLFEFSTVIEIFCTKTAQYVYAECFAYPPFTHWRGEPVTLLPVTRAGRSVKHDAELGVKPEEKEHEPPGFMGFLPHQAARQKKTLMEF